MDKIYFIDLTNKLYKLTLYFPNREPLRNKIRETADQALADLVLILEGDKQEKRESAFNVERNLEILDTLLELSKTQNWIEAEEIQRVQDNYYAIKKEVEEFNEMARRQMLKRGIGRELTALAEGDRSKETKTPFKKEEEKKEPEKKETTKKEVSNFKELNERQKDILNILKKKGEKMQVKDFQEDLKGITKRTIRRDLSAMVDKNIIKRTGKGNTTYYII